MKILIATTNLNKLREIRPLLAAPHKGAPYAKGVLDALAADGLVTLADLDPIPEPEETGATFWENARIKALAYAQASGLITAAEDSGFEVDALGGEPGVRSARFLGASAGYEERFAEIYRRLNGRPSTARFVTALAVARGSEVLFETETTVEGMVSESPRGRHGFGYDPIFLYLPAGTTTAEMSDDDKATISHRGRAFRDLRRWLASEPAQLSRFA